jgi:Tol biopolymer transport system component
MILNRRCLSLSLLIIGLSSILASAQEQAPAVGREPLTDLVQLTSGFSRAGEAYFSPDMKWIIFQAAPKGEEHYQMYIARLKWTGDRITGAEDPIRISPRNSRNTCGFFSPDNKTIIFATTAGKEKPDEAEGGYQREGRNYRWAFPSGMEIIRFVGWQEIMQQLEAASHRFPNHDRYFELDPETINKARLTNNDVYDAEGSFSPDGKYICYTHGAGKDADIYVMRPDGTGQVRITTAPGYDGGPFFSPDGKRLLYRSDRKGNDLLQVFVADLAFDAAGNITGAKAEHQLTDDANVNWGPFFHPDNTHIIYATSAHGHANYELYLMRDDGSKKTRITYHEGADVLPVFSPDGKWLMWTSKRAADNTSQVFAARFAMPKE